MCFLLGAECLATPLSVPTGVQASDATNIYKEVLVTCDSDGYDHSIWRNTINDTAAATQVGTTAYTPYSNRFTDTNVVRGVVYYYWMKTIYYDEVSAFSAPDTGYAGLVPAPTNVQASDATTIFDRHVDITWDYVGASNSVWRNTINDTATAKQIGTTVYADDFTDTNVAGGVVYYYWAKAIVNGEVSDFSAPDTGSILTLPVPTGVQASDGTNVYRQVIVSWDINEDFYSSEYYSVWRNTSADTSTATQIRAAMAYSQNSISLTDTNVARGVVYYYWVRLVHGDMSDFSAPDTGYANALPVPTNVRATGSGTKNVVVTWEYPAGYSTIVTNFDVWRGTNNSLSASELIGSDGGGGNGITYNYCLTNSHDLVHGVDYYYWVHPIAVGEECGFSAPATGKIRFLSAVNDFDGDGCSDVVVYRDGYWSIYSLSNGVFCYNAGVWGGAGSVPLPGDYDGDGNADAAIGYNGSDWSVFSLTAGVILSNYTYNLSYLDTSDFVPDDYDGDGISELAVFSGSIWQVKDQNNVNWPGYGVPVSGDYDGDGKFDFAVYSDGYWSIYSKTSGVICNNAGPWGGAGWIPVPGDYDGDGKSDLAVYKDGYWSIYSLANGIICYEAGVWGGEGWIPVPGDYDGDGKSDAAVYCDGYWSIYSMAGHAICINAGPWGGIGYIPLGTGLRQFVNSALLDTIRVLIIDHGYSTAAHWVANTVRAGNMLKSDDYGVRTIIDVDVYDGTVGRYIQGDGYSKLGARYAYMIYGSTGGTIMFIAYFSLY